MKALAVVELYDPASGDTFLQVTHSDGLTSLDAFALATYGMNETENELAEAEDE